MLDKTVTVGDKEVIYPGEGGKQGCAVYGLSLIHIYGEGYPMLYVFENCRAFIRTVPGLSYSTTAPEDVDTGQEDHAADESRYFCMMRPIAPRERTEIRREP